jgi:type II secretory pathway component PulM
MFIKNMSKRERYIALAAVSFVGLAILYSFILDPIAHEWQSLNSEMESKAAGLKTDFAMLWRIYPEAIHAP